MAGDTTRQPVKSGPMGPPTLFPLGLFVFLLGATVFRSVTLQPFPLRRVVRPESVPPLFHKCYATRTSPSLEVTSYLLADPQCQIEGGERIECPKESEWTFFQPLDTLSSSASVFTCREAETLLFGAFLTSLRNIFAALVGPMATRREEGLLVDHLCSQNPHAQSCWLVLESQVLSNQISFPLLDVPQCENNQTSEGYLSGKYHPFRPLEDLFVDSYGALSPCYVGRNYVKKALKIENSPFLFFIILVPLLWTVLWNLMLSTENDDEVEPRRLRLKRDFRLFLLILLLTVFRYFAVYKFLGWIETQFLPQFDYSDHLVLSVLILTALSLQWGHAYHVLKKRGRGRVVHTFICVFMVGGSVVCLAALTLVTSFFTGLYYHRKQEVIAGFIIGVVSNAAVLAGFNVIHEKFMVKATERKSS